VKPTPSRPDRATFAHRYPVVFVLLVAGVCGIFANLVTDVLPHAVVVSRLFQVIGLALGFGVGLIVTRLITGAKRA